MQLHFVKEKINYKTLYGICISQYRYSLFINDDEPIGEYFIAPSIDYFAYDDNGCGANTNLYSIDKNTEQIIELHTNNVLGKYSSIENSSTGFAQSIINENVVIAQHISKVSNRNSILCSGTNVQLYITLQKEKEIVSNGNHLCLSGYIEYDGSDLLLAFSSIYFIEKFVKNHLS